ncbi:glycoside hydrolase family 2 protein [Rhodopirellula sp. SWK7]|uniref:glycoside hydrolase family 2 protein n=1 Tax=Rhodopirellula sp. SWK7 TaxID=595460 RepID=UPI0002BE81A5|nr:glycoside hydrolase family 2 [Rhodopirellula sp. SWK7]EMI46872.1 glycoside hydrolase family 2 [Rhodopirellula sp. SWK7]
MKTPRIHSHTVLAAGRICVWTLTLAVLSLGQLRAADPVTNTWKFTTDRPDIGWQKTAFNDSSWQEGEGGFGTQSTPGSRLGTTWKTGDIWLRKSFNLDQVPQSPALLLHHDDETEVFINGSLASELTGWRTSYTTVPLDKNQREFLTEGENVLAVHCHQDAGGQYIDVHVIDAENPPTLPPLSPFNSKLITQWGSELTPENAWTEYPRPQLVRENWTNLNGMWDYTVTPEKQFKTPDTWDGEILVPFCLESRLGGVQRMLDPTEALWYHREFDIAIEKGKRTLLNFEAVDYRCEVFINDTSVGTHQGGNTPFAFDITDAVKNGVNTMVVRVEDDTEAAQLRGKQVISPGGIMYTQVSGIWQTVWLEQVSPTYLNDLSISTNAADGTISIVCETAGDATNTKLRVVVKEEGSTVAETESATSEVTVTIPNAKLWSPDSPHLYSLEVELLDASNNVIDQAESYAGIRSVGKAQDADGNWQMTLNGKPIFHWGPLDQGWWPDGLLTPPSDEGMLFDIEWLKAAGFNMIRKHIKVEPRRYYYHCDRLGMMVWQDQVSGGKTPPWTHLEPNPTDAEWSDAHHDQFMLEFDWMIDTLENHPSIVVWGPFNEAWGQHRTMETGQWTVERDPSRLVNIASGGNFWPVGDIADQHAYPNPFFPVDDGRFDNFIQVVGEFGGHGYPVEGHLWDAERDNWGYGGLPKTMAEYRDRYQTSLNILNELRHKGVAAGVYTQTTDVEGEINGLMTYDRKVEKIPPSELSQMHRKLFTPISRPIGTDQ